MSLWIFYSGLNCTHSKCVTTDIKQPLQCTMQSPLQCIHSRFWGLFNCWTNLTTSSQWMKRQMNTTAYNPICKAYLEIISRGIYISGTAGGPSSRSTTNWSTLLRAYSSGLWLPGILIRSCRDALLCSTANISDWSNFLQPRANSSNTVIVLHASYNL